MWGYPLWLFVGLWIVMAARSLLDRDRIAAIVAAWAAVFAMFAVSSSPIIRCCRCSITATARCSFRATRSATALTQRFHAATGAPLRYVIGSMWDGGNLAHYSPDQPQVLIDGLPHRAPWIDLGDLRKQGRRRGVDARRHRDSCRRNIAAVAGDAEVGAPFDLPMRRGTGAVHVGWAIVKPRCNRHSASDLPRRNSTTIYPSRR